MGRGHAARQGYIERRDLQSVGSDISRDVESDETHL